MNSSRTVETVLIAGGGARSSSGFSPRSTRWRKFRASRTALRTDQSGHAPIVKRYSRPAEAVVEHEGLGTGGGDADAEAPWSFCALDYCAREIRYAVTCVAGTGSRLTVSSLSFSCAIVFVSALCPHYQFTPLSASVRSMSWMSFKNA